MAIVMSQLTAFERALSSMKVEIPRNIPYSAEHTKLPNLVRIYRAFASDGRVPTQEQFAARVAKLLGSYDPGVIARVKRAYIGLIRQHHFMLMLEELGPDHGLSPLVIWDEKLDHLGVDLLVVDKGLSVGIRLTLSTWESKDWQEKKLTQKATVPGLPEENIIHLYAEPWANAIGDFWLHPKSQIADVAHFIFKKRFDLHPTIENALYASLAIR